jgi:hypothetical protein
LLAVAAAVLVAVAAGAGRTGAATGCTRTASAHETLGQLLAATPAGGVACLPAGSRFAGRAVIARTVTLRPASGSAAIVGGVTVLQTAPGSVVSGLQIHGRGAGRAAVLVEADSTRVSGNTIDGRGYADRNTACVFVDRARGTVIDGNRISSCTLASRSGLSAPGVFVGSGYGTRITNDLITHTAGYGIVLGPNAQHSLVAHDIVDRSSGGVLIDGNGVTASSYNVVESSILSNLGGHGVLVEWQGLTGKENEVRSNCIWHAFGGPVSGAGGVGVRTAGNLGASPRYASRTDYTITGGPCSSRRPSFLGAKLAALPRFTVHYSLLALPHKVRIDSLSLTGAVGGAKVVAVCTRACSGSVAVTAHGSSVPLSLAHGRWVPVGTVITVNETSAGRPGAWARVTVTGLPRGVSIVHGSSG